jgi:hypothetical protein
MPAIQVRDVPEEIYRSLTEEAKRERRSLSQQIVVTLARGLEMHPDAQSRRRALFEEIRKHPIKLPLDPVALVRQDRNR